MNREERLRQEIDLIEAVTAEFEAAAGDLLTPSSARAREEVIELLGVNYVGPEMLGQLLYGNESKFQEVDLDYVKLKEILNEPDEWDSTKMKFETYALVFKPPISFLELRDKANEVANEKGTNPVFYTNDVSIWYKTEAFATESLDTGCWELVRRETVPDSTSRDLNDQKALIADKPALTPTSLPALAALLVGQYLAHDIKLYDGKYHYGRTSTCAAAFGPVALGYTLAIGACVDNFARAFDRIGLAVSRNIN